MDKSLPPCPHIAVFGNIHQTGQDQFVRQVLSCLDKAGFQIAIESKFGYYLHHQLGIDTSIYRRFDSCRTPYDLAISIGGDGTFLSTAALVQDSGIPILGINTGRLGFLADVSPENFAPAIDALLSGDFSVEERSVIAASNTARPFRDYPFALNEVAVLKHDNSSLIEIRTYIDGSLLTNYIADGIVVCTPTGSTGYSLSTGGPIMAPSSHDFCLSAVAPHSLYIRPVVLCDDVTITLDVTSRSHNFLVSIDGRSESFPEGTRITLRKAGYKVKVVKILHKNFFDTLKEKMMWGMDSRN